jgi:hypothetical protein
MADIKTALERVINEWEGKADNAAPQPQATQPGQSPNSKAHLFKPINGVTQATFDLVKANPGITVITKTGDWDAAKGVDIVRVHDVEEMVQVARVADAVVRGNVP